MCRPEGVELTRPDLEQLGEREEDVDYNCPACVVGESDRTGLESGGDFWGDFWDDFFFWRFIPRKLQKIRALCDFFFFFLATCYVLCIYSPLLDVMRDCWSELPESRPDLGTLRSRLKVMKQGMKANIMDQAR